MLNLYLNKSNIIKLQLQSGRGAANLANVDKIVVKIDDVEIDSSSPENITYKYITWLDYLPKINEPNLFLRLGKHPDLVGYEGYRELRITVFDAANVHGLVWIDQHPIALVTELDQIPIYNSDGTLYKDEKVAVNNVEFSNILNNDLVVYNESNGRWENKKLQDVPYVLPVTVSPINNNEMFFQLDNDTTLTIKVKGSDGIIRSTSLTLS